MSARLTLIGATGTAAMLCTLVVTAGAAMGPTSAGTPNLAAYAAEGSIPGLDNVQSGNAEVVVAVAKASLPAHR